MGGASDGEAAGSDEEETALERAAQLALQPGGCEELLSSSLPAAIARAVGCSHSTWEMRECAAEAAEALCVGARRAGRLRDLADILLPELAAVFESSSHRCVARLGCERATLGALIELASPLHHDDDGSGGGGGCAGVDDSANMDARDAVYAAVLAVSARHPALLHRSARLMRTLCSRQSGRAALRAQPRLAFLMRRLTNEPAARVASCLLWLDAGAPIQRARPSEARGSSALVDALLAPLAATEFTRDFWQRAPILLPIAHGRAGASRRAMCARLLAAIDSADLTHCPPPPPPPVGSAGGMAETREWLTSHLEGCDCLGGTPRHADDLVLVASAGVGSLASAKRLGADGTEARVSAVREALREGWSLGVRAMNWPRRTGCARAEKLYHYRVRLQPCNQICHVVLNQFAIFESRSS